MVNSDLLSLTVSMTWMTLLLAGLAAIIPRYAGDTPNPIFGIRTRATQSSDEAWQLAHRVAQPFLRRSVQAAGVGLVVQLAVGAATGFGSVESSVVAVMVAVSVLCTMMYAALKGHSAAKALSQ